MTEQELNEFLERNKESIAERCNQVLLEKVCEEFKWKLPSTVQEAANEFLEEHIKPEIQKELLSQKGAIIEAVKKSAAEISLKLTEEMTVKAVGNLACSYKMSKICKELFD